MLTAVRTRWRKLRSNLNFKRVIGFIWSVAKGWSALALGFILLESILFLTALYFLKSLIDSVNQTVIYPSNAKELVVVSLIKATLAAILYVVVKITSGYINELHAGKVGACIDDKIHARAVDLDLAFYESPAYYDLLKRAKDAGPERTRAVVNNIADLIKNAMMFLAVGAVLISIDWVLIPLIFLFIIPTLCVRTYFADRLFEWQIRRTSLERKSSYISTLLTGDQSVKEVRSYGLGHYLRSSYLNIQKKLLTERFRISRKSSLYEIIATCLSTVGFFACIGYICLGVIHHTTTLGEVTLFLVIFPQSFGLMQSVSSSISNLYQNNIFISNLFELLDLKSTLSEAEQPVSVPESSDVSLEIKNVSFTYPHSDQPVLQDISLTISSGKIVAVVGLNGAGKTTLIKLLCRFYDPTQGGITMNGVDIRSFATADFRRQVGVVFQDFGRYSMSVADNIRWGDVDRNPGQNDLEAAAKSAGAHDFIEKLPHGYNTMMGRIFEDGQEISIGQWQKLAIARAFYSAARFLIFDEATSALDVLSEDALFQSFRERLGNRGALIISHRMSAIKHADYIYVLSGGRIMLSGTYAELFSGTSDYAELLKSAVFEVQSINS